MKITIEWTKKEEIATVDLVNQITEIDQDTIKNIGKRVKEEVGDMVISEKESGRASLYISDRITTEFIDMMNPVVHMTKAIIKAIEKAAERVAYMIKDLDTRITTDENVTINGYPDTPFYYMYSKIKKHSTDKNIHVSPVDENEDHCSFVVRNFDTNEKVDIIQTAETLQKGEVRIISFIDDEENRSSIDYDTTDVEGIINELEYRIGF